jgi:hypothetical protein
MTLSFLLRYLLITGCIYVSVSLQAQTKITGRVHAEDPVTIFVTLCRQPDRVLAYDLIDEDGNYQLIFSAPEIDSVDVIISGMTIKKLQKTIKNISQVLDFKTEMSTVKLDEVVVTAKKINTKADTISYSVATYSDQNDKVIRDVLRKMPGIRIMEDGQIQYKGKWIQDFYIEGLDMLEGRYEIAINNINAKDDASVDIMEHHQRVKALQGKEFSDKTAINLKLKTSSKGAWGSNFYLALGGTPFAYDANINAMVFSGKMQNISYYKTNNIGKDLRKEMNRTDIGSDIPVNLVSPSEPNISQRYYYLNKSHAATFNQLYKINENEQLSFSLNYFYDRDNRHSWNQSSYFVSPDSTLLVNEDNKTIEKTGSFSTMINYKKNANNLFLQNKTAFLYHRLNGSGDVNDGLITETVSSRSWNFANSFSLTKNTGKGIYNVVSSIHYNFIPAELQTVNVFSEQYDWKQFRMTNRFSLFSRTIPHFRFNMDGQFILDYNHIYTRLLASQEFSNNLSELHYKILLNPYFLFFRRNLQIMLTLPAGWETYCNLKTFPAIQPQLSLQWKINDLFNIEGLYIYRQSYLSISQRLQEAYYQNYRTLYYNKDVVPLGKTAQHQIAFSIDYQNILKMLFGNLGLTVSHLNSDQILNNSYSGETIIINRQEYPADTDIKQLNASISKGFYTWQAKIALYAVLGKSKTVYSISQEIYHYRNDFIQISMDAVLSPVKFWNLSVAGGFSYSSAYINDLQNGRPLLQWHGNVQSILYAGKKLSWKFDFNYYYNNAFDTGKNKLFLNSVIEWQSKLGIFSLDCINLLDTKIYSVSRKSAIHEYYNSYSLRGLTILIGYRTKLF